MTNFENIMINYESNSKLALCIIYSLDEISAYITDKNNHFKK